MAAERFDLDVRVVLLDQRLVPIGPNWIGRNMRSGFWRLYIHDRDGAVARTGEATHPLVPGRAHLIPAWLTFDYDASRPAQQFFAHFDLVRWTARVTQTLAPRPVAAPFDPVTRAAWAAVREGYRNGAGQSPATVVRVKALIHAVLAGWLDGLDGQRVAHALHAVAGRHEVEPALSHIERHLGEPLTNDRLADLCHYSTDHFAKVFKRVVGQTPGRYIAERRVALAAQALAFTDRSIDDIARSLGFGNRFYFSRAFKRRLGTPPAAYRANIRLR